MPLDVKQDHYKVRVRGTPFHERTAALNLNNDWQRWAGYTVANSYFSTELEYFAIRNAATLYDVSPMIKYRIGGAEAEAFCNRLVTRDVAKLKPGRVAYVVWCNDAGHVLDDGTLFRFDDSEFRLCCQERHLDWLLDCALGFDVKVEEVTWEVAGLALQGPTSAALLRRLGLGGIDEMRPFDLRDFELDGHKLAISRTGFTGDLGYELWMDPEAALPVWDRLFEAGALHGLRPAGSAALDLARIEAGFIMTKADFMPANQALRHTRGRSPFELGLGWLVDFGKGHFNGRRALLAEKEQGSQYCLVGLDIQGNKPAPHALIYHGRTVEVGQVTSAMWSPTCKKNIALASFRRPYGDSIKTDLWVEIYVLKELKWDKLMVRCKVVARPFFAPERRRATPPGDF